MTSPPSPPHDAEAPGPAHADDVSALMRILNAHWVMTLATPDATATAPYPTPLFYALDEPGRRLVFASSPRSAHAEHVAAGDARGAGCPAAAAVYLESEQVGQLRGAQLRGVARALTGSDGRELYLARHPVAQELLDAGRHQLYAFEILWAKLTDNRLGFGAHPIVEFAPGHG